jgi:hypothetical protein
MVLSEDNPDDKEAAREPTGGDVARGEWYSVIIWILGFLFLAVLALWDMVAAALRSAGLIPP